MAEATPPLSVDDDQLFRLVVESAQDYAIFVLDRNGFIRSWNQGARAIKGYEPAEVIGKHFSIFYTPPDIQGGKPEYVLRVAAAEGRYQEEGWRLRKGGSRFWASVVVTGLRDPKGELIGFAKMTRDLTERKQFEEYRGQLLRSEQEARREMEGTVSRLRAIEAVTEAALANLDLHRLLESLLDRVAALLSVDTVAVLLLDKDDPSTLVARAARGIEEEVEQGIRIPVGRGFAGRIAAQRRPLVMDDVEDGEVLNPILRERGIKSLMGVPLIVEGRVLGVLHVGSLHYRSFQETDVQLLQIAGDRMAMAIDHAYLYEAARSARVEADLAEEAVRERDEFLSVAAHELKTPITALRVSAQLLLRQTRQKGMPEPMQLHRTLSTLDRQLEKLSRLVTHLLEKVRMETGHMRLRYEPADLAAIVRGAVEETRERDPDHVFQLEAPDELPVSIDTLRIEQVLDNLLDNAIKYSPEGGPIEIVLSEPKPGMARLEVRDHGIGVPLAQRPHLFERYFQAHSADHRSGMGLGLYISREIVRTHGGTIEAQFPIDGGTMFIVNLPTNVPAQVGSGVA